MTAISSDQPVIAADFASLLAGATDHVEVRSSDAKSGSWFETLRIGGEPHFFKSLSYDEDWIMRVTGDVDHRQFKVWQAGIYHRFPASVDHATVGMAVEGDGLNARLGILMRDIGQWLVPEGDALVSDETHLGLIADMARLHASFLGFEDTIGLTPLAHRMRFFAPDVIAPELRRDDASPVVLAAAEGWRRLPDLDPQLNALVRGLHQSPDRLANAMAATPATFVPGDWKMGNLGRHADGRTILLDCAYPGEGPGCWDLAWYLAINCARLPISKEDTIAHYRDVLAACGVDTSAWFEEQLELCLLGMITCFGWEKALGDRDELAWWADPRDTGSSAIEHVTIADAYSATGAAWRDGPERIYGRLADELVARTPVPLRGRIVIDLGAGTGAASRALLAAGATPIAIDNAAGMLSVDQLQRPPAVVADALAMPLRDGAVEGVVAAFSLNHLADPVAGLRECRRVASPGSPIVASAYAADDSHPVKATTEVAAAEFGWVAPDWYAEVRGSVMPMLATLERAAEACAAAGLDADVANVQIAFPQLTADDLVAWRLGMMHLAPFVAALPAAQREQLTVRACHLLGDEAPTLVRSIIVISAVVPAG